MADPGWVPTLPLAPSPAVVEGPSGSGTDPGAARQARAWRAHQRCCQISKHAGMISQHSQHPFKWQSVVHLPVQPFKLMQVGNILERVPVSWRMLMCLCMQVDREVMMTTGEAAATNDKLPKGFMYVPANTLANSRQQPH